MGPLQTRRFSRRGTASSIDIAPPPGVRLFVHEDPDDTVSRHEPQALSERVFPRDPYAEWLAQRESDREHDERQSVRWVHGARAAGHPTVSVAAIAGPGR
jgi:hypothetical protein